MKNISRDTLIKLINQKYSITQLAREFERVPSTIRYWLKKFKLKTLRGPKGKHPKDWIIDRKCACGETNPKNFYGNKTTVCAKCHNKHTHKLSIKKRVKALLLLGGKCNLCGFDSYRSALHIHHKDPNKKNKNFKHFRGWNWDKILKEIKDCEVMCANCHAAYHNGEISNNRDWRNSSVDALGACGDGAEPSSRTTLT